MDITLDAAPASHFEIWFESLFDNGRGLAFPCDQAGHVDIDALSERGRSNYFFARAMLGREYATPRVVPCHDHQLGQKRLAAKAVSARAYSDGFQLWADQRCPRPRQAQ